MRRMHWWSAAAGAGLLGAGVLAAPAAFAEHHPTTHSSHGTTATSKAAAAKTPPPGHKGNHDGHGHGHGPKCPYPPHGAPTVGISAARNHVHPDTTLVINGTMKVNGCGYGHVPVGLYKLVLKGHHKEWVKVADAATADDGSLTFTLAPKSSETYRVITAASNGLSQAWSNKLPVSYRAFKHQG